MLPRLGSPLFVLLVHLLLLFLFTVCPIMLLPVGASFRVPSGFWMPFLPAEGSTLPLWRACHVISPRRRGKVLQRQVKHLIDWTHKVPSFQQIPAPALKGRGQPEGEIVDWHSTLPQNHLKVLVQCKYIYSPTKWAVRRLTVLEMMMAYDIPETLGPPSLNLKSFPWFPLCPKPLYESYRLYWRTWQPLGP